MAASAAAAPSGQVDLLHAVPTTVAVSSTVDNTHYLPEHLIDGDLGTAWNSKTGDLVGAWIAFRVPVDAQLNTIRMTAGFTRIENKQDYFTMNPRIQKVSVFRDGALVREQTLDVTSRQLQDIAVNAGGGDYKIVITEIVPGSKKDWREACVSELQAIGTLPLGSKAGNAKPTVRVGSLDPTPALVATKAEPILLVLPGATSPVLVLGAAADAFNPVGAPVVLADAPHRGSRDLVAMQPIQPSAAQRAWLGKHVQLEGREGTSCNGTIGTLGVVSSTASFPEGTQLDAATFNDLIWKNGRHHDRLLVGTVTPSAGTPCKEALWAHDPAVHVTRGRIETKKYRDVLFDDYFSSEDGYRKLEESYTVGDLNGEYEDAHANEQKIPVDERLTEHLVRRTFHTFAACGTKGACVGLIAGTYGIHHVARASVLEHGKVTEHLGGACGEEVGDPILAADLDGDGEIELVYVAGNGIGFVGRQHSSSIDPREGRCSNGD